MSVVKKLRREKMRKLVESKVENDKRFEGYSSEAKMDAVRYIARVSLRKARKQTA